MRPGPTHLLLALSALALLGCDSAPRAELQAARAELKLARAELQEARADLNTASERLGEATRELTISRRATHRAGRTPTSGGPSSRGPSSRQQTPELAARSLLQEAAATAIECIDDHHCTITRAFIEQALIDPAALIHQARFVPHTQDGVNSLRLYAVRPRTIPARLGLRNGDTLTAINDLPLSTMDAALEVYAKLRDSDHLVLKLIRRGKPLDLQIDIVDTPVKASPRTHHRLREPTPPPVSPLPPT